MTWTYSSVDLSTDLAKARLAIGDTDTNAQLMSDEEINSQLSTYGSWQIAAAYCCNIVAAKLARDPSSRSAHGLSTSQSVFDYYRQLKDELLQGANAICTMTLTGSSEAAKETLTSDDDAIQPWSTRDQYDNNG